MVRFHKFYLRNALQPDVRDQKKNIPQAQKYRLNFACNRLS